VQPVSNIADSEHDKLSGLLDELKRAHREVAVQIAHMDEITSPGSTPDGNAAVRWRISQASMDRRRVSLLVRTALLAGASEPDKASLKAIQQADEELAGRSRAHVTAWPPNKLDADWPGYCEASRLIRSHMSAHITLEQKVLYRMLERR
jgi:hypothetical protein